MRARNLFAVALAGASLAAHGGPRQASVEGVLTSPADPTGGAVVFLVPLDPAAPPPVLDSVVVDQLNLRFEPRVTVVTPGTRVSFRNSDPTGHNVFSPPTIGADFDMGTYARGDERSHLFSEPGAYLIFCHVHPEMVAYVVAVPTAWFAVTDDAGRFRIAAVPAGRYTLRVWHRRLRDPSRVITVPETGTLRLTISSERARHARLRNLDDPEGR